MHTYSIYSFTAALGQVQKHVGVSGCSRSYYSEGPECKLSMTHVYITYNSSISITQNTDSPVYCDVTCKAPICTILMHACYYPWFQRHSAPSLHLSLFCGKRFYYPYNYCISHYLSVAKGPSTTEAPSILQGDARVPCHLTIFNSVIFNMVAKG